MDDVFADDDDVVHDRRLAEASWEKMHKEHGVAGYREGFDEGKEVRLQAGFSLGVEEGRYFGAHLGKFRGIVSTALRLYASEPYSETVRVKLEQLERTLADLDGSSIFSNESLLVNADIMLKDTTNGVAGLSSSSASASSSSASHEQDVKIGSTNVSPQETSSQDAAPSGSIISTASSSSAAAAQSQSVALFSDRAKLENLMIALKQETAVLARWRAEIRDALDEAGLGILLEAESV